MRAGLLLIDLQNDYLQNSELKPASDALINAISFLLEGCRQLGIPVFHINTLTGPDGESRMPHWKKKGIWFCVEGTPGALPPAPLVPATDEAVFTKPFFSAFGNPGLREKLQNKRIETLILAGVHTHACVRSTALDAYQAGFKVLIASDAVGSYDPEHAGISLDYLDGRAARCLASSDIVELLRAKKSAGRKPPLPATWLHRDPTNWDDVIAEVPLFDAKAVDQACSGARRILKACSAGSLTERSVKMRFWLKLMEEHRRELTDLIILEVAKPKRDAEAELEFALSLLQHTLTSLETSDDSISRFRVNYRPLGVIGLITPWNNPLAIPVGKLAPALGYGNAVVWKPALQAHAISNLIWETLREADLGDYVQLVTGDPDTGRALVYNTDLAAISFTGSVAAGKEMAAISAGNGCRLQAELGGNNGVIILADADPEQVAYDLVPAIFSFSGQRCTAPRRIIVEEPLFPAIAKALKEQTERLTIGLPADADTFIGPVISRIQQENLLSLTKSTVDAGGQLLCGGKIPEARTGGCWLEPTLIVDPPSSSPAVTEESFGPLAVLLRAQNFDHALNLCNDTHYGLVAGIFSNDLSNQQKFIAHAEAGILLVNQGRPDFDCAAPFAGWKASGSGIPEHGRWDRDFYTQVQTLYT